MEDTTSKTLFALRVPATKAEKNAWKAAAAQSNLWFGDYVREVLNKAVSGDCVRNDMRTGKRNNTVTEGK